MNNPLFQDFDFFVLDASFHRAVFSDRMLSDLAAVLNQPGGTGHRLYAASTIQSELRGFIPFLQKHAPEQARILQGNLQLLEQYQIRPRLLDYSDYRFVDGKPLHDTKSLIRRLLADNPASRILVLTGNESLIERIVLEDLPVSFYHLPTQKLCQPESFGQMRSSFELRSNDEKIRDIPNGSTLNTLFDAEGKPMTLTQVDEYQGNEASIYAIEARPDRDFTGDLAKVYNFRQDESSFSVGQAQNLVALQAKYRDCEALRPWAMLPTELIYAPARDAAGNPVFSPDVTRVVGHLMKETTDAVSFDDDSRFNRGDGQGNTLLAEALKVCATLIRQALYLSHHGIFITDMNTNNFATAFLDGAPLNDNKVYMWDTGSFTYKNYLGSTRSADLEPIFFPDPATKLDAISFSTEMLHLLVMKLLSNMFSVKPDAGTLPFLKEGNDCRDYRFHFPDNIWKLIRSLYQGTGGARYLSLEVLLEELDAAAAGLQDSLLTFDDINASRSHPAVADRPEADVLPWWTETVTVTERRFPRKSYPPVHPFEMDKQLQPPHRSGHITVSTDPYPPVFGGAARKPRIGLRPWVVILFLLAAVLVVDMVLFSASDLGFAPKLYLDARLEALEQLWQTCMEQLRIWFSAIRTGIASLFTQQ